MEFKNVGHFAARLGIVPSQHSSGNRKVLMNIVKREDQLLRKLFIHRACAVVSTCMNQNVLFIKWIGKVKYLCVYKKATVAFANKNTEIVCSIFRNGDEPHMFV